MARYTGAVRFPDGELMYFVYNGTVDTCRRTLYKTKNEAFDAWDEEPQYQIKDKGLDDEEPVEVMPYYCHGKATVEFTSRASKSQMVITGPTSLYEVSMEQKEHYRNPYQ